MADDVIAIMDELGVRNLHFLGYSLGALVGFELLTRYPERMRIVMLGGGSPIVTEEVRARWGELARRLEESPLAAVVAELREQHVLVRTAPEVDEEAERAARLELVPSEAEFVVIGDEKAA